MSFLLLGHGRSDPRLGSRGTPRGPGRRYARSRARRFPAHINERGSLSQQLFSMRDGLLRIEVKTAVGERIGRHIYHPHDQGATSQFNRPGTQVPMKDRPHAAAILERARIY